MPDYHIYTIPLWDAYKKQGECPLCNVERVLEGQYLDSALGGSVMEPDTRIAVNKEGFCGKHLQKLSEMQNVLSLSLMLHTHYRDVLGDMNGALSALEAALAQEEGGSALTKLKGFRKGGGDLTTHTAALATQMEKRAATCHICHKIEQNMERYIETLFHMYKTETEFRQTFCESRGFCLSHLAQVSRAAGKKLGGGTRRDFLRDLIAVQRRGSEELEKDLEWFTLKFDYRNADKPWGNAKTAVSRTITRLRGAVLPEEK